MCPQHFGDLLHRFEFGAHGSRAPGIEKFPCPCWRLIGPETLEIFLEEIGPHRPEVTLQQVPQLVNLVVGEIFRSLQQTPTTTCQNRFLSVFLQFFGLFGPDRINGFAHVAHDMKPIQDIDRTGGLFRDNLQVWFPHVATDKLQLLAFFRSEPVEEFPERLGGTIGADPEQSPFSLVKLIHQGHEFILAFPPADFISTDRCYAAEITMFEPPVDRHFHRTEDCIPTCFEYFSDLFPTQPFSPCGKEPGISYGEMALAISPWHFFDFNSAGRALDSPWCIEKEHRYAPQGDIFEVPASQGVIARSPLATFGADWLAADLRSQRYEQSQGLPFAPCACIVDKIWLFFYAVQDSLYLHPVWPPRSCFVEETFWGTVRQDVFFEKPNQHQTAGSMEHRLYQGQALRVCACSAQP